MKRKHETDNQQLTAENNPELENTEGTNIPEKSNLTEEYLEAEFNASSNDLMQDALDAAEVIEGTKKEKPKPQEDEKEHSKPAGPKEYNPETDKVIAALKSELESKNNQLKRLAADFENFRRRQVQEREDLLKYSGEKIILDILPILDNFERAISSSKNAQDITSLISGVELIQKQLYEAIGKNGVEPIVAVDNIFDPNYHEAVQQFVDDSKPDQTVIHELQKGYTLSGKVIRPSMVVVSTTSK
jgi:molecular chaperone GrpE